MTVMENELTAEERRELAIGFLKAARVAIDRADIDLAVLFCRVAAAHLAAYDAAP